MSRLTDKRFAKSGFVSISSEERKNLHIPTLEEVYAKLAEYESLEEQGRLIKLPCKVGDRVYPLSCYGYEQGHKIISVNYYAEAGIQSCEFEIESDDHGDYDTFELDDIGVRVFFNKDERDRKLDEDIQKEVEAFERVQKEAEAAPKT